MPEKVTCFQRKKFFKAFQSKEKNRLKNCKRVKYGDFNFETNDSSQQFKTETSI